MQLLLAACQYPPGVLDRTPAPTPRWGHPTVDHMPIPGPADATRAAMQRWVRDYGRPDAYLWAGDWIYIDATAGLFDPLAHDSGHGLRPRTAVLDSAYAAADRSPWRLPGRWLHAIDDHEVDDNWEPSAHPERQRALEALRDAARAAFLRSSAADARRGVAATWFTDHVGSIPVFVADTRTQRDPRPDPQALRSARILDAAQWQALAAALAAASARRTGQIVLCGSIVLPRRMTTAHHPSGALRSDAWDGYPASLRDLLATLAEQRVAGCVFLSGDEHLACVVEAHVQRLDDPTRSATFWSVHAGAAYAPFPFANSRAEHFADERCFRFEAAVSGNARQYRCTLATAFAPAHTDGFVSVHIDPHALVGGQRPRVVWHAAGPDAAASYPLMSPAGFGARAGTA